MDYPSLILKIMEYIIGVQYMLKYNKKSSMQKGYVLTTSLYI